MIPMKTTSFCLTRILMIKNVLEF
ncbi:hypothetical protein RDABS01_033311 [Bienertia sinuspersici]